MNKAEFGKRLRSLRKAMIHPEYGYRGVTQEELAQMSGVLQSSIGRYEKGEITPRLDMAIYLATTLEVSLDYLAGIKEDVSLDSQLGRR